MAIGFCPPRRYRTTNRIGSWLLGLAALTLLLFQPLDALGHVAAEAQAAGNQSLVVRVVSAFDVLDDSLDHGPDRDHSPSVQQQVIAGLPCCATGDPIVLIAMASDWAILTFSLPPNQLLSDLFRPPRA